MFNIILFLLLPLVLLAQKPNLMLLKVYKDQNITGWVMSEKLDGIRAYWDGEKLLTRSGNIIHAPKWFTKDYPPFEIDGELWSRRGDFENISSIVRDKNPSDDWKRIKHYIFEVPNAKGGLFERLAKAKAYESSFIKIIPQIPIRNKEHLKHFLTSIEQKGGEGVVIRDPKAPYISNRTNKALKVKTFLDKECKIIAHNMGNGKYRGILGSVTCVMENNITFKIGSGFDLKERKNPPAIGSIITFRYKEMTKYGKPRFPVFLRVRYYKRESL
jgi:DNA ligase-1